MPRPRVHRAPGLAHRHRARLAVRGRARSPKIGLFQAGSHRIVDTPRCLVHHPLINEAAARLKEAVRESGVAPYADRPHTGLLRYAQFVVERSTERVQVVLVGRESEIDSLGRLPEIFASKMGDRLQGLFFSAQTERSNAILGPTVEHLSGESAVRESLGGVEVFFPPAAFGQNHLPLFETAIGRIHALVPDSKRVAEAYCGVGAIGLGLLGRAREVRFNERSEAALRGLEQGLAHRPAPEQERARLLPGRAGEQLSLLDDAEIVILDPPRKGLDPGLLDALTDNCSSRCPERVLYLACGLDSLLRDLDRLEASGRLRLAGLEVFDFFPFTQHVETLAWLDAPLEAEPR